MIQMMKKPVSIFLAVLMVFSCFSVMGMTAYADNTCTVTFKANGRTVSKEVTLPHTFSCNYSSENGEFDLIIKELYQLDGGCCGLNPPTVSGSTNVTGGISGDNQYITVNAPFEGTATFDSVYFDSSKGYMDFEIHLEISCTGAVAAYSVTITPGSNMTKTSGEASQTGLSGPMTAVVYTANDGYKFPETSEAYTTTNGITVAVSQDQKTITVSGTPTADTSITIPDAVEELLTTITATGKEQANYSTANVATVSFSYTAGGSSAYLANWGWWGYGWTATVNAAEGYTITKCVFYDDANRTATDSSSPFVVETTEEDKTPRINGTPILAYQSKGITKIEVYGYAVPSTYTVTWQNDDGTVLETDTDVAEGTVPTYNGETPTKPDDAQYTYTFTGWSPEVVAATADATYTATYTATPKANNGVNLTVGNDITSNYYVDYSKYTGAQKIRYSYNCVNELEQNVQDGATIALDEIPDEMKDATSGRFVLEVSQAPAQMAEPTVIEILGENDVVLDTLNYSAKTYCDKVIGMTVEQLAALPDVGTTEKAEELQTLCHTMIAYGQAAQGVFADYDTTKVYCENADVNAQIEAATPEANYSVDNSGMIKFSGVSFVCTKDARLRFYLNTSEATSTPAAPTASTGNAALKYTLNGAEKQYFVEVSGINAADFNEQITVNYGGSTINFSVLDFAGIVLRDGSGASAALQHFAKTLVVYNTNALAFFGN